MKYVAKGSSPGPFEAWKAMASAAWQPTYATLRNPEKKALHEALLMEQGWVCCYCGRTVALADSHIEHFLPQESAPALALEFTNLFASCIREREPGAPLHCGHAKGADFDARRQISPLAADCERRFIYTLGGAILPADVSDEPARYMSDLLKLDLEFLRNRRREVLAAVFDVAFLASATEDELRALAAAYRVRDEGGALPTFGHVVARFADQLMAGAE